MRSENLSHNIIVPIKSLIQKSKQTFKKQFLQITPRNSCSVSSEKGNTPKNVYQKQPEFHLQVPELENYCQDKHSGRRNESLGLIQGKRFESLNDLQAHDHIVQVSSKKGESIQCRLQHIKSNRSDNNECQNIVKEKNMLIEMHRRQTIGAVTPKKSEKEVTQQCTLRNKFKSTKLQVDITNFEKYGSNISDHFSGKAEDQTWNASKFEKTMNSSREIQPIYKTQLTKIKTELFQKEACLFQLTQKLQEKEGIIQSLTLKLQQTQQLSKTLQKGMQKTLKQIQQDYDTNIKILNLKLRQSQIEGRQKTQYITQLKQRERKIVENNEKIIKGLKELLRQKEEQITKIGQAAQMFKQELLQSKENDQRNLLSQEKSTKDTIIQDLSGQLQEAKTTIQELQIRMREMIQNEEELKKDLQLTVSKQIETIQRSSKQKLLYEKQSNLQKQFLVKLKKENLELSQRVKTLEISCMELQNDQVSKDFQLSIVSKACEQYIKKIEEYQTSSEKMRDQIQTIKEKEYLEDKISGRKVLSLPKQFKLEEKQVSKLKTLNTKLSKQLDRAIATSNDVKRQLHQLYKVNKSLNQNIIELNLEVLNNKLLSKMKNDE